MKRLRFACAALAGWFFVLFNIERFHAPLNIASFVYVLAAVVAMAILGVKELGSVPQRFLLGVPLAVLLVMKNVLGYPVVELALPITVMEIGAITVTVVMARDIAFRINEFEAVSAGMMADNLRAEPPSLEVAQSALYREVRRAREHSRPLAVLAVAPSGRITKRTHERLVEELQLETLEKYTAARVADLLAKEAKDHGIVTQANRHFIVLLPETDRNAAHQLVGNLNAAVQSTLGLKLQIGVSTFPDEEVTLVGLLKRAEQKMRDEKNGRPRQLKPAPPEAQISEQISEQEISEQLREQFREQPREQVSVQTGAHPNPRDTTKEVQATQDTLDEIHLTRDAGVPQVPR